VHVPDTLHGRNPERTSAAARRLASFQGSAANADTARDLAMIALFWTFRTRRIGLRRR
jgi:hypothetical protein